MFNSLNVKEELNLSKVNLLLKNGGKNIEDH